MTSKPGVDERRDHPPPDPLGLRPPVDEQEGPGSALPLVHVRLLEPARRRRPRLVPRRVDVGTDGHDDAQPVVLKVSTM